MNNYIIQNRERRRASLAVLTPLILCGGCAGNGAFDYKQVPRLDSNLGRMQASDYQRVIGKPRSVSKESGADGTFEEAHYESAAADSFFERIRSLNLEFRDGKLNGYCYASSFEEDQTSADNSAADKIIEGKSSKADVTRLLGRPSGMARVPTDMVDFKDLDKSQAVEVWYWARLDKINTLAVVYGVGDRSTHPKTVVVGFDAGGIVTSVGRSEQK